MSILHGLGDAALLTGETDAAAAYYRDAARLARELDSPMILVYCLGGLAAVAARRGQNLTATELWGALQRLETQTGQPIETNDRARYEQFLPPLDETALANGWKLDDAETWALALDTQLPT